MPARATPDPERKIGPVFNLEGRIDQSVAADRLVVPGRVELHEGSICYQFFPGGPKDCFALKPALLKNWPELHARSDLPKAVTPPPKLIDKFIRLADAPDEDILSFARQFGVLELCAHGLPNCAKLEADPRRWSHAVPKPCVPLSWTPSDVERRLLGYQVGRELTSHWRTWARRARAIMRLATAVEAGRPGKFEDLLELNAGARSAEDLEDLRSDFERRGILAMMDREDLRAFVNYWGEISEVRPQLVARPAGIPVIRFAAGPLGSLFGMLGLQMMVRITRVGSMALCSKCGSLYKPDRAPDMNRLNFCQTCGRAGAMTAAKQRLKQRKTRALEMHASGASPSAIAEDVGSKLKTVTGWIKNKKRTGR